MTLQMVCVRVCVVWPLSGLILVFCALPQDHRCCMPYTPICIAKAVKNSAESEGMRRAHVSGAAGVRNGAGGQKDPALSSSLALDLCPLVFQSQWENEIIMLGMQA